MKLFGGLTVLLSDKIGDDNLFKMIGGVKPFPFIDDGVDLSMALMLNYGDRKLFSKMEAVSNESIARLLVLNFGAKWEALVTIDGLDLDVGASSTQIIDEKTDHREGRTNKHDSINKTGAFNDVELVADSGSEGEIIDDVEGDSKKNTVIKFMSVESVYNNLSLLQKNSIIDVVLRDVSAYLTLDIY